MVSHIADVNRSMDRIRETADLPVLIPSHPDAETLVPEEWADASEVNRADGSSENSRFLRNRTLRKPGGPAVAAMNEVPGGQNLTCIIRRHRYAVKLNQIKAH